MILSVVLAVVAFAALLPIVLPLLNRAGAPPDRSVFDQAVYRDQLRELDRDIARGLLTEADAQASRLEIQRRLLASDAAADSRPASPRHAAPVLALIVAVIVGGGSVGLLDHGTRRVLGELWVQFQQNPDLGA